MREPKSKQLQQESIPVGCIPSAAVAVGGGVCPGECMPGGVSAEGGVYSGMPWGKHLPCEQNDWQTPVKILPLLRTVTTIKWQKFCCTFKDKMSIDRFPKTVGLFVANSIQEQSDEWGNNSRSDIFKG